MAKVHGATLMQGLGGEGGGEGQLHLQFEAMLKSMGSSRLIFLMRSLGTTARIRLWNEGRSPVSERVSHVDASSLRVSQ